MRWAKLNATATLPLTAALNIPWRSRGQVYSPHRHLGHWDRYGVGLCILFGRIVHPEQRRRYRQIAFRQRRGSSLGHDTAELELEFGLAMCIEFWQPLGLEDGEVNDCSHRSARTWMNWPFGTALVPIKLTPDLLSEAHCVRAAHIWGRWSKARHRRSPLPDRPVQNPSSRYPVRTRNGHAAVVISSQPSGVTFAWSPARSSTVVNADSITAGPSIICSGDNLSKSKTGVAIHWSR
jgi:hypothetical protein